jgi:hypothetical protein
MRAGVALAAGRGRGVADAFDVARGVTLGIALGVALGLTVGGRDAVGVGVGEEAW